MMPSWLSVLKMVPWSDVIQNAPKAAEGAKKLWGSVSGRTEPRPAGASPGAHSPLTSSVPTLSDLQNRIDALEDATDALHAQMLASSALIKTLTEQNAQLIARVEVNRRRLISLAATAVLALLVAAATAAVVLLR
jgi:hypothetical protein